jgi:hypothetical protein
VSSHLAMVDVFGLVCMTNDAGLVAATWDRATMFAALSVSQRQPLEISNQQDCPYLGSVSSERAWYRCVFL